MKKIFIRTGSAHSDIQPKNLFEKQSNLPYAKREIFGYRECEVDGNCISNGNGKDTLAQTIRQRLEMLETAVKVGREKTQYWRTESIKIGWPMTAYNYGDGLTFVHFGRVQKIADLTKEKIELQTLQSEYQNDIRSQIAHRSLGIKKEIVEIDQLLEEINQWHQQRGQTIILGKKGEEKLIFCIPRTRIEHQT